MSRTRTTWTWRRLSRVPALRTFSPSWKPCWTQAFTWASPPHCRAPRGAYRQRLGRLLRALSEPPGSTKEPGYFSRRNLGGGLVLPGEGGLSYGHLARDLGRLRRIGSAREGEEDGRSLRRVDGRREIVNGWTKESHTGMIFVHPLAGHITKQGGPMIGTTSSPRPERWRP